MAAILVWIGVALVALYLAWRYHPRYGANPGIPCFPIVGALPFFLWNKHRLYERVAEVFNKAPSLTIQIHVGTTTTIATVDPRNVEHILRGRFHTYPKGPDFYPFFADLLGSGIFNTDGPLWLFQRKVASHVFNSRSLRDFVVHVADAEICNRMIPAILHHSSYGNSFDLQAMLMDYTFDTTCQFTFGADPACLKIPTHKGVDGSFLKRKHGMYTSLMDDDSVRPILSSKSTNDHMEVPHHLVQGFAMAFQVAVNVIPERFLVPNFVWQTKRRFLIGNEKKLIEAMKVVDEFSAFVIEKSKKEVLSGKFRNDILGRFMQLSKEEVKMFLREGHDMTPLDRSNIPNENQLSLSDTLLKDILLSFVLAGREAVASGVTFLIWLLCLHPEVQMEVCREIQSILEDRKNGASGLENGTFSFDELKKMNYLHACLSESMRLYPPVPGDCKYAIEDDILPNGTHVQKGCQIALNVFAMGRCERVWGNDSHQFKPERWLSKETREFVPTSPYKYPVFLAGPRICLGKDFAFIQMKLLIATLLQNFKFELPHGFQPKLSYGVNMNMVNGLHVYVKRREFEVCERVA